MVAIWVRNGLEGGYGDIRRGLKAFRLTGVLALLLAGGLVVAAVPASAASAGATAWGDNEQGQLGDGATGEGNDSPVAVSGLSGVAAVSAGEENGMALLGDHTVMAWGNNGHGQLGDGSETDSDVPVKVSGVSEVTAIAGGFRDSLAVSSPPKPFPTLTAVEPGYGAPAGGTHVTITGTNFNEVSAVEFGATAATSFEVVSESTIEAVAPAGTGVVEVTVTTPGGTSPTGPIQPGTPPGGEFSYAPLITAVTPGHGAPAGGTEVTITGANFTGATAVRFGSNNARSFKVESDTKITAVTPACGEEDDKFSLGLSCGEEDGVGVYITTPGGTNTSEECGYPVGYRYEPTITKVEPSSGAAAGGTLVTIHGAAFEGTIAGRGFLCSLLQPAVQGVKFGSTPATHVNIVSDTEITAVAPAGSGTVDVTLDGAGVDAKHIISTNQFSYAPPATQEPKTEAATAVTSTSAILVGTLEPAGAELKYEFEYNVGASCEDGLTTPEAEGENRVSTKLEGLTPNSEYTFCLVAQSIEGGTTAGKPQTLRTAESQAEKEAKEAREAKEKAEAEAEVKAEAEAEAKAKSEAEAAVDKEKQEEVDAAAKKTQEEEAAAKREQEEKAAEATGSVSLEGSTITVQSSGRATVKLTCTGTVTCSGKLTLSAKGATRKGKTKHTKMEAIGTVTFSVPVDRAATMTLTLNVFGRALLSADHERLSATLTVLSLPPFRRRRTLRTSISCGRGRRRGGSQGSRGWGRIT